VTDQPQDRTAVDEAADVDHAAVARDVPGRDGGPEDQAAMRAAEGLSTSPSVDEEYGDMLERGAQQRGEGRVP
jgi:hypothetical protein